ncbi:hypothetical protein [Ralstonia pseudosolanacearum]|uniref:hypothetical protein n=1 Tax=Ralstonia pseudosolanacearum TaxID=1310165 RepID=UPI001FFAEAE4|nr:hypothetical protein [Ralstonia pseudosolanacearum]
MRDLPDLQSSLNDTLASLKVELQTGGPHDEYVARVERAARAVFAAIQAACEHGYEIWAHKGSGRVLKMNSIGIFRGTRFSYSLAACFDFSSDYADQCERCELAVIERFEVTLR